MRVVSVNVNGIRATGRRGGLGKLAEYDADIIALQEVRATRKQLDAELAASPLADFQVVYAESAAAGREGVALLTRHDIARHEHVIEGFDEIGRWLEAEIVVDGHTLNIASVYVHTGEVDTPKQEAKCAFLDAVSARMGVLRETPSIVMGDFNIAHHENDLKNWKGNRGKAGFLPEEQAYLTNLLDAGWIDTVRRHHGEMPGPYSWWSWRGKAFDNDAGWRIDYQYASPAFASAIVDAQIGRAPSYAERWSDHAPVIVDYDLTALGA